MPNKARKHRTTPPRTPPPRMKTLERGYGEHWRKMRLMFLRDPHNALCVVCGAPATVVDHRHPHRGNYELYMDQANWQALCQRCHARKSATERQGCPS
jgi:5-methylcytosine-specific restriction protein A